uniref:Uncharacterized protein n=1 Tax=Steinernema glaseri TaxID=37863 RepID=A0A1I7YKJ2_9BILA
MLMSLYKYYARPTRVSMTHFPSLSPQLTHLNPPGIPQCSSVQIEKHPRESASPTRSTYPPKSAGIASSQRAIFRPSVFFVSGLSRALIALIVYA